MIKKIIALFILSLFATGNVHAAETVDFSSTYDVTYEVAESGQTTVSEKITLTNLTSIYYPSNFKLNLATSKVDNLSAVDSTGQKLEVKSQEQNNLAVIDVALSQQIVGIGKQTSFILKFNTPDFAQKIGDVWQISIPKFNSKLKLERYKANLVVPLSFGEPNRIFPHPVSQQSVNSKMLLNFTTESLKANGISATFGTSQNYSFNIKYLLKGSDLWPILSSITLPPDTNYQKIIISKIDPKPVNVTTDEDGNYLAWYRIPRAQEVKIDVLGEAKLFQQVSPNDLKISNSKKDLYTSNQKFWEAKNPIIKQKLEGIFASAKPQNDQQKIEAIYKYVVGLLKYDPSRINDNIIRLGGVNALQNPTSVLCMEFTDLFITLARAAGIPARELDGFAYSTNTKLRPSNEANLLHSWPEYWDEAKGWVMVDPTWENTTQGVDFFNQLDLNHIVLSIKGEFSDSPIPGSNIQVSLLKNPSLPESKREVVFEGADEIIAGFPGSLKAKIYNRGNVFLNNSNVGFSAEKLHIDNNDMIQGIPPYGFKEVEIKFRSASFFDTFKDSITLSIDGLKYTHSVSVFPLAVFKSVPIAFAGIIGAILSLYVFILGYHIYKKR